MLQATREGNVGGVRSRGRVAEVDVDTEELEEVDLVGFKETRSGGELDGRKLRVRRLRPKFVNLCEVGFREELVELDVRERR